MCRKSLWTLPLLIGSCLLLSYGAKCRFLYLVGVFLVLVMRLLHEFLVIRLCYYCRVVFLALRPPVMMVQAGLSFGIAVTER